MGVRVSIAATALGIGDTLRVWYATTLDDSSPPDPGSPLWQTAAKVPVLDLPTTVLTPPRPRGTVVWTRGSGEQDGARVTNYTEPVATVIPALVGLTALFLQLDAGNVPVLYWTAGDAGALAIRAGSAPELDTPVLEDEAEVDAEDLSYQFGAALAAGYRITVEVTTYETWDGSGVDGAAGSVTVLTLVRAPAVGSDGIGCRLVLTDGLDLIITEALCLVTTEGA